MEKIITPMAIINRIKKRVDELKAEGIEPTVENLNARGLMNLKKRIKEADNE